jgi:hypothetical protein
MSNKLLHTKVSKRKPLDKFPSNNEGHNGDMQIVSIKGKGTYLCIKNKGQWEISEKFNPKNKFDTHEFDSIKSQKIYGKSGLNISLKNESISTNTYAIKTAATSTESQPLLKIGNGSTPGVLSSLGDQDLLLKTGNSTSSNILITDGANGSITNAINGYGKFDIVWDSNDSSSGKLGLLNINTGNACLAAQVSHGAADAYVRYAYLHDTPSNSEQWVTGFDGTDGSFKINYLQDDAALTPSNGSSKLTIDTSGNVATAGTLTIGDINADSAGDNYLVEVSGVVKKRTPAQTLSDLNPGLDDLSDVTYSSGDLTISSLDTIISGALTIDSSGSITIDSVNSSGAITDGTLFKTDGTTFGSITTHHALSCFTLFEAGGSSTDDYLEIQVDAAGATSINTVDAGGATAHLTLNPDGNVFVSGADLTLDATKKVGFDGSGGHTYVHEEADDFVSFVVGGQNLMALQEKAGTSVAQSSKIFTGCPILLKDVGGAADVPASGYGSVYVNSDRLYFKDDSNNAKLLDTARQWFTTCGFYMGSSALRYLPLIQGPYEQSSLMDFATDDAIFIVPYNMKINTIYVNTNRTTSTNAQAGNTSMKLYRNGAALSNNVTVDIQNAGYDSTDLYDVNTFDFSGETNAYNAGDTMQISIDPTSFLYYVSCTIVGEWT